MVISADVTFLFGGWGKRQHNWDIRVPFSCPCRACEAVRAKMSSSGMGVFCYCCFSVKFCLSFFFHFSSFSPTCSFFFSLFHYLKFFIFFIYHVFSVFFPIFHAFVFPKIPFSHCLNLSRIFAHFFKGFIFSRVCFPFLSFLNRSSLFFRFHFFHVIFWE